MAYRYIPMMKTKAGEITALSNLPALSRSRILPLLHVCENVSPSFAKELAIAWSGNLAGVDGSFNFIHSGSSTAFTALVVAMRNGGIATVPSFGPSDPVTYQQFARAMVDGHGALIKVSVGNIPSVPAWLWAQGISPSVVDLVVDLKHIAFVDLSSYAGYITSVLQQNALSLVQYRSVTLASAAAPKDHTSLQYGANRVARTDWLLWSAVSPTTSFQLDYGDYLTGHPDLTEPPGVAMASATVSARYTLDAEWLIIKGRSTNGPHGQPMGQQYIAHAGLISSDPGFSGVIGSWADSQIMQAAAGAPKMGSRGKWSGFAANRHLWLVADRLP